MLEEPSHPSLARPYSRLEDLERFLTLVAYQRARMKMIAKFLGEMAEASEEDGVFFVPESSGMDDIDKFMDEVAEIDKEISSFISRLTGIPEGGERA